MRSSEAERIIDEYVYTKVVCASAAFRGLPEVTRSAVVEHAHLLARRNAWFSSLSLSERIRRAYAELVDCAG